jgi:hypothetical protein
MAWQRLIVLYLDGQIMYFGRQAMTARSNNGEYSISECLALSKRDWDIRHSHPSSRTYIKIRLRGVESTQYFKSTCSS